MPTLPLLRLSDLIPQPGEKIAVLGQNGSGKTTGIKRLLGAYFGRQQILILDLKVDPAWNRLGHIVRKFEALGRLPFPRFPVLVFRPTGPDAHDLAMLDRFFEWVYQRGNTVLVIDEVTQVVAGPTNYGPGFNDLLTRGRIRSCTVFLGSQRPAFCPRICWSESTRFFIFYLVDKRDRQTIAGFSSERAGEEIPDRHGFLYVNTRERVTRYFRRMPLDKGP